MLEEEARKARELAELEMAEAARKREEELARERREEEARQEAAREIARLAKEKEEKDAIVRWSNETKTQGKQQVDEKRFLLLLLSRDHFMHARLNTRLETAAPCRNQSISSALGSSEETHSRNFFRS